MRVTFSLFILAIPLGACTDPAAEAEKECQSVGGSCVAFADCEVGEGFIHADERECGDVYSLCCLPECGDDTEDFECSDGEATFRPWCVDGALECQQEGMSEQPL